MNYLQNMYGLHTPSLTKEVSDKNPNRVRGGLRAQGVDHFEILSEDGVVHSIPSKKYVESIEEQLKKQQLEILQLKRRVEKNEKKLNT